MSEMQIVAIKDMSAGNDSVGEMWQETKIFGADTTLRQVVEWADGWSIENKGYTSKRIIITVPAP